MNQHLVVKVGEGKKFHAGGSKPFGAENFEKGTAFFSLCAPERTVLVTPTEGEVDCANCLKFLASAEAVGSEVEATPETVNVQNSEPDTAVTEDDYVINRYSNEPATPREGVYEQDNEPDTAETDNASDTADTAPVVTNGLTTEGTIVRKGKWVNRVDTVRLTIESDLDNEESFTLEDVQTLINNQLDDNDKLNERQVKIALNKVVREGLIIVLNDGGFAVSG